MLDLVSIFTTGGVLLFYKSFCELDKSNVNQFVSQTILQDKIYDNSIKIGKRIYKWVYDTERGLIFLFVYQELFQASNIDEILTFMSKFYLKKVWPEVIKDGDLISYAPSFESNFNKILKKFAKKKQAEKSTKHQQSKNTARPENETIKKQQNDTDSEMEEDSDGGKDPEDLEPKAGILKLDPISPESQMKKVSFVEDEDSSHSFEKIGDNSPVKQKLTARERAELARQKKKTAKSSSNENQ